MLSKQAGTAREFCKWGQYLRDKRSKSLCYDNWVVGWVGRSLGEGSKDLRGRVSPGAVSMRIKLMVSFSRV